MTPASAPNPAALPGAAATEARPAGTGGSGAGRPGLCTRYRVYGRRKDLADDIDTVVVDRLAAHIPVEAATYHERRAAVVKLYRQGVSTNAIAERLVMHKRQVWRDLAYAGLGHPGRNQERREAARKRRIVVARLHAAGARQDDIARLLHVEWPTQIHRDHKALGLTPNKTDRRPRLSHAALLALYGHLLAESGSGDVRGVG